MYLLRAGKEGLSDAWFRLAVYYNKRHNKDSALYYCMIAYHRGHPLALKLFHKLGGNDEQLKMPISYKMRVMARVMARVDDMTPFMWYIIDTIYTFWYNKTN